MAGKGKRSGHSKPVRGGVAKSSNTPDDWVGKKKHKASGTKNKVIVPGTLEQKLREREAAAAAAAAAGGAGWGEAAEQGAAGAGADGGEAPGSARPSYLELREVVPMELEEREDGVDSSAAGPEGGGGAPAGAGARKAGGGGGCGEGGGGGGSGARAVLPRVVPWRDWGEWAEVGQGLLGGGAGREGREGVRAAVRRVRAWQSRGKVPHAVEATASLAEVALARGAGAAPSEHAQRLMLSMAVVRLVNGISDAMQQSKCAPARAPACSPVSQQRSRACAQLPPPRAPAAPGAGRLRGAGRARAGLRRRCRTWRSVRRSRARWWTCGTPQRTTRCPHSPRCSSPPTPPPPGSATATGPRRSPPPP